MTIIEKIHGNAHESPWKETLKDATIDHLTLDQWDAQKNRFRKESEGGLELAVSLDRGTFLKNGDILQWDPDTKTAVVTVINLKDVLVVEMKELLKDDPQIMLRTAVELGHALGNQHWPAVVKGTQIFVPMSVDRKVMASMMKTHAFENISYKFVPGAQVIPYMAPHESRRLFGGAEGPVHSHSHAHH